MIVLPMDASPTDIDQWCGRGIIMYTDPATGTPLPGWYRGTHGPAVIRLLPLTPGGTAAEVAVMRGDCYVHWPRCGSVNMPGLTYAVHAERLPQRQFRRTWGVSGLRVTAPRAWDVAKALGQRADMPLCSPQNVACGCFFPDYPSLDEAEAMIGSGQRISVALTPRIILAGDMEGKRMFYYNGIIAATAERGSLYPLGDEVPFKRVVKLLEGRYHVATDS